MMVVMQYQGVPTGPGLFTERPDLGYGVFMAMFVTYLLMSFTILPMSRYMSRVTLISTIYMSPIIIAFTLVGSFVPREYMFDMYLAFAFGILGYIARKTGYHVGIMYQTKGDNFYLRPELVYTSTKSEYISRGELTINKVDMPILLGYHIFKPISIFAGPSLQYILDTDLNKLLCK